MADLGEFNAEQHGEMSNFDPIPPDKYEGMIVDSDMKPTKAGDLNQLVLVWQVTDGVYQGRKIWTRINLPNREHPVESLEDNKRKAIEIGGKELATICRALGKPRISDSAELHNIPCIIDVRIRPAKGDFPASNEIKGYSSPGQLVGAGASAPTAAPAPQAAKSAVKTPPWANKK